MKVHYIACARSSSVDGKTNELSLFHVLDEIAAATFPLRLESLCVASLFEREADDASAQSYVVTVSLDQALLASFTMQVDFARARRNRSVSTIQGLLIPAPGTVDIALVQKTRVLATWRLMALRIDAPAAAPKPGLSARSSAPPVPKAGRVVN